MAKVFKDVQHALAIKANTAICKLHDIHSSNDYIGERNHLSEDELLTLRNAHDICIRIVRDYEFNKSVRAGWENNINQVSNYSITKIEDSENWTMLDENGNDIYDLPFPIKSATSAKDFCDGYFIEKSKIITN